MSIDAAFTAGEAIKFPEVGSAATFTVTDVTEEERKKMNSEQTEAVVIIHGKDEAGDEVRLFCQKPQLRYAIGTAIKEATGRQGAPQPGGKLHVKRGPDGTARDNLHPPHSYTAKYQPPPAGASAATDAAFSAPAEDEEPF